jgi:phosphoribosylformylglycinamidine synthase subunit PurS
VSFTAQAVKLFRPRPPSSARRQATMRRCLDWPRSRPSHQELFVPRVVVDVMPKPEILDPQGKAVLGALPRLGFHGVTDVRQGKRFELEFEGEMTDEVLDEVREMAQTLLSNPVIENYTVSVETNVGEIL